MTTVTAVVQPTEPPRVRITVSQVIAPTVSLLANGSFETPDMGGASVDFNPVPWYEYLTRNSPGATRAPFVMRQGPNPLSSQIPYDGARYFMAAFTADAVKARTIWMAQDVPVTAGLRVTANARMMASQATGAGNSLILQVVPMKGTQAGTGAIGSVVGSTYGTWTALTASVTIPPGYDAVSIQTIFQGAAVNAGSLANIDAVTATAAEPAISTVSLWREVDGIRTPVRGAQGLAPSNDAMVFNDNEAPFGKAVTYVFVKRYTDGTTAETIANPVTLTTVLPWISHPITGVGVTATISEWPELTYAARQTIVAVAGRSRPIVISDRRIAASSELVMLTRTRAALLDLRALLATGDPLLVRPVCDAVEGDYLAIGDVSEARVKPNGDGAGSDWRRLVSMDAQAVDAPDTAIAAIGDTLADLASYAPGTLAELANAFGAGATLLTIAQTNLAVA